MRNQATKTMKVFQKAESADEGETPVFFLTDDDFEMNNLCEAYNEYGRKIECEVAGCNSLNNHSRFSVGEKIYHAKMRYETYWNGHKMISIIVDGELGIKASVLSIDKEKEREILNDYQNAVLEYEDDNVKIFKGSIYKFTTEKKLWSWELCTANKLNNLK